ncbi:MAG TPA: hypothetical protein PK402_05520, partial [Tepidisphaeraceae bacterium]|nr:hypothetical protein [Tepidisphaeraceae bacterium]
QNVTVSNNSSQDATVVNYGTIGSNHANGLVKFGTWWDGTRVINRGHIYATNSADLDIYNARESLGWVELRGEGSSGYVSGEFDLGGNIAITGGAIMKFVGAVNGPAAIDLEGSIIFDYPTEALSPVADVGAMISSGYANGAWNGPGIRSSFAATHPKYAVGFADAFALYEGGGTITTAALSIAFDETSVLARTTLKGDANLDLTVNFNDLLPIAQNYGATNSTWITGDFNYDGMTGFQDLLAAAQNYGSSALSLAPAGTFAAPSRRSEDSPRVDALLD